MLRQFGTILIVLTTAYLMTGCDDEAKVTGINNPDPSTGPDWLIPIEEVFDGGPGKDGIPALLDPPASSLSRVDYLSNDDLIIGVNIEGDMRAYPHALLDWHEIINDHMGESFHAITYCPLTGSGIGWNRNIQGGVTTFGVSGYLYNTNLIPYDRKTNSNWSQMGLQSVNGSYIGRQADLIPVIETTWQTWKIMYPESEVVTDQTGYTKPYGRYPYGDYRTNNNRLIFPVNNTDDRLAKKERVLGVLAPTGSGSKVYRIGQFPSGIQIIQEIVGGEPLVIAGSAGFNFAVTYHSRLEGTVLNFTAVQNQLPVIMSDNEGTTWDIFGNGVSGPRKGQRLDSPRSYIAYWFAWAAFYPGPDIAVF